MKDNNIIDKSIETISDIGDTISSKYNNHIKQKAIKNVDENLKLHDLTAQDIEDDDYEAMISDEMSKIKENYSSNVAKVALGALGLDLLFGV